MGSFVITAFATQKFEVFASLFPHEKYIQEPKISPITTFYKLL